MCQRALWVDVVGRRWKLSRSWVNLPTFNWSIPTLKSSRSVSLCRGSYDGYAKHKRNDPMYDPWDSQGIERNAVSISIAFCLDFFDQKWKYNFRGIQNKKPFEIILHVGRVTSLRSWVAKKSCPVKPLQMNVLLLTTFQLWRLVISAQVGHVFSFATKRKSLT